MILYSNVSSKSEKIRLCTIYTFVVGIIAHGFGLLNYSPSHDSLVGMFGHKYVVTTLGRFLVPLYRDIFSPQLRGNPWITGITVLLWISISVYLLSEIFDINCKCYLLLTAGIMVTNITITGLLATYIQAVGDQVFSMLLAIVACYYWIKWISKRKAHHLFLSSVCIYIMLALYQASLSVFFTLVIMKSIIYTIDSINSKSVQDTLKSVIINGIVAIGVVIIAGVLYYISLKPACYLAGTSLNNNNYNSVTNLWNNSEGIIERIYHTYESEFEVLFMGNGYVYPDFVTRIINSALLIVLFLMIVMVYSLLLRKSKFALLIIFISILFLLLPICMNLMRILNHDLHILMCYSYWIGFYVFLIVLFQSKSINIPKKRIIEIIISLLICTTVFLNCQISNAAYIKKELEQKATLSAMTRMVDKIESLEEYVLGETPVAFVGVPGDYFESGSGFTGVNELVGLENNSPITYSGAYKSYIENVLHIKMNIISADNNILNISDNISSFPSDDCVIYQDGIVVAKW